ncbi:hypothetical protein ACTXT7_011863 [Hymenolepis weldensis]
MFDFQALLRQADKMSSQETDTPYSEIIFDTPNDDASQAVEEPKTIVQQEAEVNVDYIPTDLDEFDVEHIRGNEEAQNSDNEEENADGNDHAGMTPGSGEEAEVAMEENDHEVAGDKDVNPSAHIEAPSKLFHLPTSRIKSIVKLIPSVHMVNSEAIAVIGKATEMFLKELVSESYQVTRESGKKILAMAHIEGVIQTLPQFEFLDGMLI